MEVKLAFLQENLHMPLRKASLMSLCHIRLLLSEHPVTVCSVLSKTQAFVFYRGFVSISLDLMYRPLIPRAQKRLELMDPQKLFINTAAHQQAGVRAQTHSWVFFLTETWAPLSQTSHVVAWGGGGLRVGTAKPFQDMERPVVNSGHGSHCLLAVSFSSTPVKNHLSPGLCAVCPQGSMC